MQVCKGSRLGRDRRGRPGTRQSRGHTSSEGAETCLGTKAGSVDRSEGMKTATPASARTRALGHQTREKGQRLGVPGAPLGTLLGGAWMNAGY